ncbi:single-stranded-DNA-specific exonuclease RecJ [Listeria booriae]|uniref:single-stranded-DNA-specific exonuclease RecJ n=1 Tax=Listeria booriae TaxID=1552123 RepID=UPI00162ABEA9|nr:single-stranded-DNA-specific exonuclease RecJ [Listeria booriae]MBC1511682.1 single-stranded-DNA-specific exonuclease RecJ [Listeria booriae]MBC6150415.1 single-stranded-DNA-specific exonuclease RecJ [Listeria booriae]MBC6304728.1 single-stranded-DNA-specific exonuclease RecJ [Listeria booriae]
MIHSKYKWQLETADEKAMEQVAQALQCTLPMAELYARRKVTTAGQLDKFLHPDKYEAYDPFLLAEMELAVTRIKQAIDAGEQILVFGDYDADGVTSVTVLLKALRKLGAEAEFYIPNRFTEGYGPNKAAFTQAKDAGVGLLITVDNGIAALDVMAHAKEIGLDVIVTDHHEAKETMPEAVAVIHPRHPESNYPFPDLAGVGVAYKLAHALLGEEPTELLDLVAIGTVADLVSLTDENRLFVQKGLRILRDNPNIGVATLAKLASTKLSEATEETIGFTIAPRLNAVGRLGPADPAADLLLTEDPEEAVFLAEEIDEANKERQAIVTQITEEAIAMIEAEFLGDGNEVFVLDKAGWNPGVVGIVASRLVDRYARPVIVLGIDDVTGIAKGSGRSIEAFHLYKALDANHELLTAFGGHPMAAGMTLNVADIPALRANLAKRARETLTPEDFISVLRVEEAIPVESVTLEFIGQLNKLAPFGTDNPKPVFALEGVKLDGTKRIGADKTHLKTAITSESGAVLDAVGFGTGELVEKISPMARVDIVGELSINEWNNMRKPQLRIVDLKIGHWQLFDVRSRGEWEKLLQAGGTSDKVFICFQQATRDTLLVANPALICAQVKTATDFVDELVTKDVIFADMPEDVAVLEAIVAKTQAQRIYLHVASENGNAIASMPSRQHFAQFYAVLKKHQPFPLQQNMARLCKQFSWTSEQVDFMSRVFFDLNFATMEDGVVRLNDVQEKRNLEDSQVYKVREYRMAMEQKLLYSNYNELYAWIEKLMNSKGNSILEEIVQ